METANSLSQMGSFEPHGQCFLWNSDLVLLHTLSDSITALAYYAIPLALLYFAKKREDLPYKWLFVLFSAFFVACGTTHLMAIWTIWKPDYWLEGALKGINAAVSIVAAGLLWPLIPHALRLPSPAQLEAANQELQKKISVHQLAEAELARSRQHLERQVRERTAELSQANTALHADVAKRMQTEKELGESREMLRQVVNNIPIYVFWKDRKSNYLGCNTLFAQSAGVQTVEAIIGKNDFELAWKESAELYRADDRAVMETGTPKLNYEEPMARPDSTTRWLRTSKVPLRDRDGQVLGVLGIHDDITERKKLATSLRESEERFMAFMNNSPLLAWMKDTTGRYFYINESFGRLFRTSMETIRGKYDSDFLPEGVVREIQAHDQEVLTTGQALETIESVPTPDGSLYDWLVVKFPFQDSSGRRFVGGLAVDITERKRMDDALRASAEYARNLIEASLDPLAAVSLDGKITDVNTASEALTGLPRERLIGSDFWTYFTEPEKALEGYRQVLAQGAVRDYPLTIRHTSGRLVEVLYHATVFCDKEGTVQGVLATARDITERKRMQEQASKMERLAALGQLLGGIAHEIKNPLFIVTGHIQLLKERLANREYDTLEADIQTIEEACDRITTTTRRFLNLERPIKPQWQSCAVHDVLAQTLAFLANELMKNRITVVRSFAPDIPETWSVPRQLQEVFLNLILNAMQAMTAARAKGTLTITTGRTTDSIVVRIQDDGPGIAPQHRARLFEPFFSTKPAEEGTGLGLWTVRSVMAGLNGTVECESVEGQGATFIVSIPIVSRPPKE